RRARWKGQAPALVSCPQCRESKLPHRACPTCGTYGIRGKRRQVVEPA
ncbi:MAG: 50S ribosomal protein L32, partial [Solirubrobacterales bacterium]|nr:50S ribosomal protein L32 [Solirubrobacterales bacterium]